METNIKDKLYRIDKDHLKLLSDIGIVAEKTDLKAYLVGGMVRDILLGYENLDIDIVVENNASKLAEALVKRFPNCELSAKHDKFHTAKVIFNINGKKIPVDLASTREEIYEHPAALPTVSVSDLKKDLYRRDFTINALAVSILPHNFGEVADLFHGLDDLKDKKIRVLHDLSFIDDPTRMIRAVRFAVKLGFEIEEHTKLLLNDAMKSGKFDNLIQKIRGDRVKIEIRYLFNLQNVEEAIKAFFESGIYKMISVNLKPCRGLSRQAPTNILRDCSRQWLIYLAVIIKDLKTDEQEKILTNLQMTSDEIKIVNKGISTYSDLVNRSINITSVYQSLKHIPNESVILINLLAKLENNEKIGSLIDEYIENISKIKLNICGDDLIGLGVKEGKEIGKILDKIMELKIKNPSMKKDDEIEEAKKLLKD